MSRSEIENKHDCGLWQLKEWVEMEGQGGMRASVSLWNCPELKFYLGGQGGTLEGLSEKFLICLRSQAGSRKGMDGSGQRPVRTRLQRPRESRDVTKAKLAQLRDRTREVREGNEGCCRGEG